MKTLVRAALTAVNVALAGSLIAAVSLPEEPPAPPSAPVVRAWAPPAWFPADSRDALWVLPELDGEAIETEGPRVRARAAIVADLDQGEVLWAKDPDGLWPVASMTKLVGGLTLASTGPELGSTHCVTPEIWPALPGARSKFVTGSCHEGWEYLGAALVKSDNRGAMAFPVLAGMTLEPFLEQMATVSAELGMGDTRWADPAGLADDNLASARGMLKAVIATAAHPELSVAATAAEWTIERERGPQRLGSTNKLRERWTVLAAKTGYTSTAGWCFTQAIQTSDGRTLATVVMGAPTDSWRWRDTRALVDWAQASGPTAK